MLREIPLTLCLIAGLVAATSVEAASRIGIYGQWGAFRDGARCYALRMPEKADEAPGAYVSVVVAKGGEPQFFARLPRTRSRNASASASVGGRRFTLTGKGRELRAGNLRMDRALIAAIRSARALSIETVGEGGEAIVNGYDLSGAASAIDAARLACR